MKLVIINGSHRSNSEGGRVSKIFVESKHLGEKFKSVSLIDLNESNIPLWDETQWEGDKKWTEWNEISETLSKADAFLITVPEWGGMVPPGLMNLLMICGPNELGHKPALLVSISARNGGANPITQLRSYAYKNSHVCYLPDHVIIRNVEGFKGEDVDYSTEPFYRRVRYTLDLLACYSVAFAGIRNTGIVNTKEFKYGMS